MADYDALRDSLAGLPATWYPDLLRALVKASSEAGAWQPGGASAFVRDVEASLSPPPAALSAEAVAELARAAELRDLAVRARALFGCDEDWKVCVWSKGADRRVYVRGRTDARDLKADVEYYHTGTAREQPGALYTRYNHARDLAEHLGIPQPEAAARIKGFCADLCERFAELTLDVTESNAPSPDSSWLRAFVLREDHRVAGDYVSSAPEARYEATGGPAAARHFAEAAAAEAAIPAYVARYAERYDRSPDYPRFEVKPYTVQTRFGAPKP